MYLRTSAFEVDTRQKRRVPAIFHGDHILHLGFISSHVEMHVENGLLPVAKVNKNPLPGFSLTRDLIVCS